MPPSAVARHLVGAVSLTITMPTGVSPRRAMRVIEVKINSCSGPCAKPVKPVNQGVRRGRHHRLPRYGNERGGRRTLALWGHTSRLASDTATDLAGYPLGAAARCCLSSTRGTKEGPSD